MKLIKNGEAVFTASLKGEAQKLTKKNQLSFLFKYPLAPALTMPRILYQATILWMKHKLPVNEKPNINGNYVMKATPYSWVDKFSIYFIRKTLKKATKDKIVFIWPNGKEEVFGDPESLNSCSLKLNNFNMFRRVMMFGGIAFGESYVDGDWDTDDLASVLSFFLNNYSDIAENKLQFLTPLRSIGRFFHYLKRNSLKGSCLLYTSPSPRD